MRMRRATYLASVGTILVFAGAGCVSGDAATAPPAREPGASADTVALEGVRLDVRRDPG